jgi:glycerate dehydrogenase
MKIVILDGYTLNPGDLNWDWLEPFGEVVVYDRSLAHEVVGRCQGADAVFTNKVTLDGAMLQQLPSLKYIGVTATGYNIVDIATARSRGIIVANAPDYGTASVVQMTFALILELCLHVQKHSDSVYQGKWTRSADFSYSNFPLIELYDKTIGIIGYGSIGRKVGEIATAFGMKILAAGRTAIEAQPAHEQEEGRVAGQEQPKGQERAKGQAAARKDNSAVRKERILWEDPAPREDFKRTGLEELMRQSDFVTIHCPLTPQTKGLINKDTLAWMKPSAFLVNTSRGPIIVEEDLAEALNNHVISGAAVDVLSLEPPREGNPLFYAKNCIITPHIAWATREARGRLMDITRKNFSAFTEGKPVNVVNQF